MSSSALAGVPIVVCESIVLLHAEVAFSANLNRGNGMLQKRGALGNSNIYRYVSIDGATDEQL